MKRFLITALLVLFATAAYAEVKFELTGNFHARGTYTRIQNDLANDLAPGPFLSSVGSTIQATPDKVSYSYYDGDVNLYPKIIVDNTSLTFKLAIRDETWSDPEGDRTALDDNIKIERAFMTHKFDNGFTIDAGLMDGQVWGTVFGDYLQPRYRVKVTKKTPIGVIGGLVEKMSEEGDSTTLYSEKDDWDDYAVFMVTKAGNIWIKPLIFYVYKSDGIEDVYDAALAQAGFTDAQIAASKTANVLGIMNYTHGGINQFYYSLELSGDLGGGLGFESEFNYKPIAYEDLQDLAVIPSLSAFNNANNAVVFGGYFNVWKTLDAGKFGFLTTYGNWDADGGTTGKGVGLDTRDDFCANLILGDWYAFGGTGAEDLLGMTFFKLYAAGVATGVDKLTFGGSFGYIISNQRNSDYATYNPATGDFIGYATYYNPYKGATAMEVDLNLTYAITDNLAYTIDAGYAKMNYDYEGTNPQVTQIDAATIQTWDDPDDILMVQHKIKFTF